MILPKPTAILFDWDNTLVNTWPIIHQALHETFTEYQMEPWTLEQVKERVARSMRDAFPDIFGEKWEEAGKRYQDNYRKYHLEWLDPLEGATDILKTLKASGLPIAVVSNKKKLNLITEIEHLGWAPLFNAVVGSDDAEFDKPHPAPVQLALAQLRQQAGPTVWFVGDSVIDLECAQNAGISALLYGDKLVELGPEGFLQHKGFPVRYHAPDFTALRAALEYHGLLR